MTRKSAKKQVEKILEPGKNVAEDIVKSAKDATEVLSKHTRMLNSSKTKRQVFYALEDIRGGNALARIAGIFLFVLIVANAVMVFFSVEPAKEPLTANLLEAFYVFSTICFFIEYLCRIWIADLVYGDCTRAQARLKYIISPLGIIDFLSFAPNMISWLLPVSHAIMHTVNVLRLIRLIKVTRYMRGFRTIGRVIRKRYQEIVAAFLVIFILIIVTCIVMYEAEHAAQPKVYTDLFQSLWYAVETVTTVGYGDIVPITPLGKICGMIIMLLGLGLVAIPGGIFSAGFVAEFQHSNMQELARDVKRDDSRSNASDGTGSGSHDSGSSTSDSSSSDSGSHSHSGDSESSNHSGQNHPDASNERA